MEPACDFFVVESGLTTGTRRQRRFAVSSSRRGDHVAEDRASRGGVPVGQGTWSVWKKIDKPALYFGYTLKQLLKARGIKVKGKVRRAWCRRGARLLHVSQSDTLDIVLKRLNKLLVELRGRAAPQDAGRRGPRARRAASAKGIEVVEDFLDEDVGMPRGSLRDEERLRAERHQPLLGDADQPAPAFMYEHFPMAPEYLSSVGIAGKDGTLKYRFEGSDAVGRLRAKTGTLENVSALSGYVQAVGGERFVFSVMVNDFPGAPRTVVQQLDALGAAVAATGSSLGPARAVAAMTAAPPGGGAVEELRPRLKTYAALAQQADQKQHRPSCAPRGAARRTRRCARCIADALYQSDPREPANATHPARQRAGDRRRLRPAAQGGGRRPKFDVPVVGSLVELASGGNGDAIAAAGVRAGLGRPTTTASALLAEQLAVVANDAPAELLLGAARRAGA